MLPAIRRFKPAKLADRGGDISKRWYVYWSVWHPTELRFVRTQDFIPAEYKTKRERIEYARQLITRVNWHLENSDLLYIKESSKDPVKSVREALEGILKTKASTVRERTIQSYRYAGNMFLEWLGDRDAEDVKSISKTEARAFADYLIQERKVSPKTHNSTINYLQVLFNALAEREEGLENPFTGIKPLRTDVGKNLAFSRDELERIKQYLTRKDPQLLLFVQWIYYTFLRPNELLQIRVRDIHLARQQITVWPEIAKDREKETLEIPASMVPLIESMRLNELSPDWLIFGKDLIPGPISWHRNRVSDRHRMVREALGLSDLHTLYSWKHTGVVHAYQAGIDVKALQRQLRHASLTETDGYLKSLGLQRNTAVRDQFPEF